MPQPVLKEVSAPLVSDRVRNGNVPFRKKPMTKQIRVENACNSNFKAVVQIWDKGYPEGSPDVLAKEIPLDHPTAMTGTDCYITSTRYLVVKEIPN